MRAASETAKDDDMLSTPSEESAYRALQSEIEAFHAGVLNRASLSVDDVQNVEAIREKSDLAYESARKAYRTFDGLDPLDLVGAKSNDLLPAVVRDVHTRVRDYLALVTGTLPLTVAGIVVDAPAIESPAIRAELKTRGDAIMLGIAAAIAAGRARSETVQSAQKTLKERIDFWLQHPIAAALLRALTEMHRLSFDYGRAEVFAALRFCCAGVESENKGVPAFLTRFDLDKWFPEAYERITGEQYIATVRPVRVPSLENTSRLGTSVSGIVQPEPIEERFRAGASLANRYEPGSGDAADQPFVA